MADSDLLSLPFDTYQRYRLVADLVGQLPRREGPLRVLDIGGRTGILRGFLPDAEVTLVDVEASDAPGLVLGGGSALPFADRSFDAVTACDTLEHVSPELRERFAREACRVSRAWVILAGPYASDRVVEAEDLLRAFLREKLSFEHRYLDEHARNGLPDREAIAAVLESAGAKVATVGHASLERWLPLMCLSMYLDHDAQLRKVARRYYHFYNQALYATDHAAPVYRHAVVGCLHGAPLPEREALLDPPAAPPGALAAFQQLLGELVAFDREEEVYQEERQRLIEVNEGLLADLEGHRGKTAELARLHEQREEAARELCDELAAHHARHEEVVAALNEDLAAHREALAEAHERNGEQAEVIEALERDHQVFREDQEEIVETFRRDLHAHRERIAEVEEINEQQDEVIETLDRDLEGHRRTLAETRRVLEEMREQQRRVVDELEGQLEEYRTALSGLQRDLTVQDELITTLRAEIEERIAHQAALEAEILRVNELAGEQNAELISEHQENLVLRHELRSRTRNLRRALSPRKPRF